jgi:hypothetical protein
MCINDNRAKRRFKVKTVITENLDDGALCASRTQDSAWVRLFSLALVNHDDDDPTMALSSLCYFG